MRLRLTLLITLSTVSILLPAQNIQLLREKLDSLKVEKSILLQKIGEMELLEQKYIVQIEEHENRDAALNADLRPVSAGEVVEHNWFTLSYSEQHEQARWVFYKINSDMLKSVASRKDNFRVDNRVSTLSAHPDDYSGSGYDRGHLCPAADMSFNPAAMSETFYMSNMSPQVPSFNRGIWKKLEATVRNWAFVEREIYVVTGPVFDDYPAVLPNSKVAIPGHYYKVVFDPTDDLKMIALVLPNARGEKPLDQYVVTVNYVESITGIDFFEALPDSLENRLEARSNASLWEFSEYKGAGPESEISVQCKGVTKSTGKRCRNKTSNPNGYCHLHQSQSEDH